MRLHPNVLDRGSTSYTQDLLAAGALLQHRFRIRRVLRETGLNVVYCATDIVQRGAVIIKSPLLGVCTINVHTTACWDLAHEAVILRHLAQYGITAPRTIDFFHLAGRPYLAMSLIPGPTLDSLYAEGYLTPRRTVEAIIHISRVLEPVHRLGYVHHDIKPANIILSAEKAAVLIDWGSTQRVRPPGNPRLQSFTPDFASLEQLWGEALFGNDIFALGRTLEDLVPGADGYLAHIIQRATAPARQRYPSVAHLKRALNRLHILDSLVPIL
jgi:eukaryotic-like serine/threonine-protein kinase